MAPLAGLRPGAVFRLPDGRVCVYDGRPLVGDATVCYVAGTGRRLRVSPSTPVELIDVPALARENDDLRGLLADACEDSRMWAAGVAAGRGEWTTVNSLQPGVVFVRRDGSVWTRGFYHDALGREADCLSHTHPFAASPLPADTPARPLDVPALLREDDALRGLLADACEDSHMWAAGVAAGRGEAAARARAESLSLREKGEASPGLRADLRYRAGILESFAASLAALGPARPPPRPHALEAEVARLRGALRVTRENLAWLWKLTDDRPTWPGGETAAAVESALAAAREALGEDA